MTKKNVTIGDVYELLEKYREEMRELYVTKGEFLPVKMIAYSIVGIASTCVIGAVLAKVVNAYF